MELFSVAGQWPLDIRLISCFEMLVANYQSVLRNIPENQRSCFCCGRILKSRLVGLSHTSVTDAIFIHVNVLQGGKLLVMKLGFHGVHPEFYEEVFVSKLIKKSSHKNMMLTHLFLHRRPFNFTGVGCAGMDTFLRISSICQTYPTPGFPLLETSCLSYF